MANTYPLLNTRHDCDVLLQRFVDAPWELEELALDARDWLDKITACRRDICQSKIDAVNLISALANAASEGRIQLRGH